MSQPSLARNLLPPNPPWRNHTTPPHRGKAGCGISGLLKEAADQSVEWRSSAALSDFEGSDLISDLTGSILGLSSCGVSTRADTSTELVRAGGCSERGRATARANSICAAP